MMNTIQTYQDLFDRLWRDYRTANPQITRIYDLLQKEGEVIINDHIAFRTVDDPRVSIEVLAAPFQAFGYRPCQEYHFDQKHLLAWHFEHPDIHAPKVFISQLELKKCSQGVRNTLTRCVGEVTEKIQKPMDLLFAKTPWKSLSYATYQSLLEESEYAAWLYVFGYRANHFTVNVNALKKYSDLVALNRWIESKGFTLNHAGGAIKGTPQELLEQSSTLAEKVSVSFDEGVYTIPCCYYEFAKRYPDANGRLYSGFIAQSADKIFESTHAKTGHSK
jgi:hypothetical protein